MPDNIPSDNVIAVPDAGVVLAAPYLPRLFHLLGLVSAEQVFVSNVAAERAAHVLRFLAYGEEEHAGAPSALDRLLCGLPPHGPTTVSFSLTATEQQTIDSLLTNLKATWQKLSKTSNEGLRETFFQRKGLLMQRNGSWQLIVEPKAVDILLSSLPWSFSTTKFSSMPATLMVTWR